MTDMINRADVDKIVTYAKVHWVGPAAHIDQQKVREAIAAIPAVTPPPAQVRGLFPVLGGGGASVDLHLVKDHGEQAKKNHYQSVARLAERGGLSWVELFAVLHNRPFKSMDTNEAMIACRGLEAKYLAAIEPQPDPRDAVIARLVGLMPEVIASLWSNSNVSLVLDAAAALAAAKEVQHG